MRSHSCILQIILIILISLLIYLHLWSSCNEWKGDKSYPKPRLQQHMDRSDKTQTFNKPEDHPVSNTKDPGFSAQEWDKILKMIQWGGPDRDITSINMSTSLKHSTFIINDFKDSYYVGEELHTTITAKDFNGVPKQYGGDFFQAKVYSDELKASVFGEVTDHQNGTYLARFTLPWTGRASVAIRLIHSSEAVEILKRHQSNDSNRIYFSGFFIGTDPQGVRVEKKMMCNFKWEGVVLSSSTAQENCEYHDARTQLTWQCLKPPTLPCSSLVYHSFGGYVNRMTAFEKALMDRKYVNQWLKGDTRLINIIPSNKTMGVREPCIPGMPTPTPAGFYLNDVWTSFQCAVHHFTTDNATQCLKDKHIYITGDSTARQWFDFLIGTIPTLKRTNQHNENQVGPLMAVDVLNNIDLHFRSHGLPLRCLKAPMVSLQYVSNQIDVMAGGPHTVVVFTMWAHFTNFPISLFANRVWLVRRSVLALLRRAPETKVIIKTANTAYKDIFGSDWYSMQLDRIMREAFRGVGVYILDVWQMTACHYNTENIHPAPVIIKNEVDVLLSFICPK